MLLFYGVSAILKSFYFFILDGVMFPSLSLSVCLVMINYHNIICLDVIQRWLFWGALYLGALTTIAIFLYITDTYVPCFYDDVCKGWMGMLSPYLCLKDKDTH